MLARGLAVPQAYASHLYGALVALPCSVLHGELEAGTDRGEAAFQAKGWRAVHLFDVPGDDRVVAVGNRRDLEVRDRDVVELAHEGRYASGELRFARLLRSRPDLAPVVPVRSGA